MFDLLTKTISEHWVLAIFFGTMLLNENAILLAFSLSVGSSPERYFGVALIAWVAVFTNDLILFAIAKYGLSRFNRKKNEEKKAETLFNKVFLHNILLSLLLIKFVFGFRIILTLYIITKKGISLFSYLKYNFFGTVLYIGVLGVLGWFIGRGIGSALGTFNLAIKIFTVIVLMSIISHFMPYLLQKIKNLIIKTLNFLKKGGENQINL